MIDFSKFLKCLSVTSIAMSLFGAILCICIGEVNSIVPILVFPAISLLLFFIIDYLRFNPMPKAILFLLLVLLFIILFLSYYYGETSLDIKELS